MNSWQTKSSQTIYDNEWISVREDQVVRPDGSDGIYGVIHCKNPAVFIVPVDEDGNTYLILEERYPIAQESWEIAGGATDGEDYATAAKRELLEEAGVKAENIIKIIESRTLNGLTDHRAIICLATGIEKVTDDLDPVDGILAARRVPLAEVRDMILRGDITDGLTITAVLTVMAYLEQQNS